MKTHAGTRASATATPRARRAAAFSLLECLVYVGLLFVILGLALMTFYRTEENNRNLSRNTEDILRTLRAGEQWRADVRQAVAPLQQRESGTGSELTIPHANGPVKYLWRQGSVWREEGARSREVLSGVANSKMEKDPRRQVTVWRWEVELAGRQRVARVKPLFTFSAVAREDK
jgi:hypothetical protein